LNETLKAQREQLDLTLAEQGRQLDRTLAEQRTRTLLAGVRLNFLGQGRRHQA
jgi:hypothetical protein